MVSRRGLQFELPRDMGCRDPSRYPTRDWRWTCEWRWRRRGM